MPLDVRGIIAAYRDAESAQPRRRTPTRRSACRIFSTQTKPVWTCAANKRITGCGCDLSSTTRRGTHPANCKAPRLTWLLSPTSWTAQWTGTDPASHGRQARGDGAGVFIGAHGDDIGDMLDAIAARRRGRDRRADDRLLRTGDCTATCGAWFPPRPAIRCPVRRLRHGGMPAMVAADRDAGAPTLPAQLGTLTRCSLCHTEPGRPVT